MLGTRTAMIMMDRADVGSVAEHRPGAGGCTYSGAQLRCFDHLSAEDTVHTQRCTETSISGRRLHTARWLEDHRLRGRAGKDHRSRKTRPRHCLARDIAGGMLRSFDYAAASVPGPHSAAWAARSAGPPSCAGYAGG